MKPFALDSSMLTTLGGVFYPTGHVFVMFPDEEGARRVAQELAARNVETEEAMLVTPQQILSDIAATTRGTDEPLPSAGSEAATVRRFVELAREGHYGLLVHAPSEEDSEKVMDIVRQGPFSIAEKYRRLVIEDLA